MNKNIRKNCLNNCDCTVSELNNLVQCLKEIDVFGLKILKLS